MKRLFAVAVTTLLACQSANAGEMMAQLGDVFLVFDSDHAREPRVGIDEQGRSYFVFTDKNTDTVQWIVYDSQENPLTAAAPLSTTESTQQDPEIAVRSDGSFFAIWRSDEADETQLQLRGRYYDASSGFDLNDVAVNDLPDPVSNGLESGGVAALESGGFTAVWESQQTHFIDPDQTGAEIQGQFIDSGGAVANGDQFHINNIFFRNNQNLPDVAPTIDGGFFVVWEAFFSTGYEIHGRRYQADGMPIGDEFQIETTEIMGQHNPRVAANDRGEFLVVWDQGSSPERTIWGRLFDSDVAPIGDDFLISSRTDVKQDFPDVGGGSEQFVVAWRQFEGDDDVHARIVTGREQFDGPAFQVNTYDPTNLHHNEIGVDVFGLQGVITWQGTFDEMSGTHSISARTVRLCGIFCDGFESEF